MGNRNSLLRLSSEWRWSFFMAITEEKARRLERVLVEHGAKDFGALRDAFEVSRTIDDHEHSGEVRRLARTHFKTVGSAA